MNESNKIGNTTRLWEGVEVQLQHLGLQRYKPVWDYQETLLQQGLAIKKTNNAKAEIATKAEANALGLPTNYLLLVEHPPVYTLGKSGHLENILIGEAEMATRGIDYFKINRGGDITFHGPGQLVGYPILDLEQFKTDIGWYLRSLEEVIIKTLAVFGITAGRSPGETGVWIDAELKGSERKICAMGVRCSRWITMHGWALNVNTDLDYFNHIIPCGIKDKAVTSMGRELGTTVEMSEVIEVLQRQFEEVFGVSLIASAGVQFTT